DPHDASLIYTAIRETVEEVGVALDPLALRATLDDHGPVTPVRPPIVVRPYLFRVEHEPALRINHEIAEAAWIPLDVLADPANRRAEEQLVRGRPLRAVGRQLPIGFLWGMTERILAPVIEAWNL
ncbi:MAG TPA: NUDIX domain-containing protein, partial [Gemmatimonadales bacterium]|nr:NUDIX domain-containing protein [Gemmatimonadales bacterium]